MMSKVKLVIFLLIFIVLVYVFYSLFWFGSVNLENTENYRYITIDNVEYSTATLPENLKLRPGEYTLNAIGPLAEYGTTFSVGVFSNTVVQLDGNKLSKQELEEKILSMGFLSDDFSIIDSRLFQNDNWFLIYVSLGENFDASAEVLRFNGKQWEFFASGTGYSTAEYLELGIPTEIVRELRGSDE